MFPGFIRNKTAFFFMVVNPNDGHDRIGPGKQLIRGI